MIDELIDHCIDEIGLDGESGTEIERLASFIRHFHADHSSRSQLPNQLVDVSYLAFVFRQLIAHPQVNIGLFVSGVPNVDGAKSGIFKRKSLTSSAPSTPKQEPQLQPAAPEYDWVDLLLDPTLSERQDLSHLQSIHGDRLRLVLTPAAIKRRLAGAGDVYLPPSTYRVLQIICRSRERAVLSTDIGDALHTDQKTVFYICKRLVDLGLVVRFKARETGTVASYFVATRFQHLCDLLIQHRNAEIAADLQLSSATSALPPPTVDPAFSSMQSLEDLDDSDQDDEADAHAASQATDASAPVVTVKDEESHDIPVGDQNGSENAHAPHRSLAPTFQLVDTEKSLLWMSSRPDLIRFRIYLVCNSTKSKVTARIGLLNRINVTRERSQKRMFTSLLEHAVVDGFLEVVHLFVATTGRTVRGLRMTQKGLDEMHDMLRGDVDAAASLLEQQRASKLNAALQQDLDRIESRLPRELTLERWLYEEVARAGPSGRTAAQLMARLNAGGHFTRVIEQIALRADEAVGEPSMSDLSLRTFHEHKLRVRSTKLYSLHAWVLQCANAGYLDEQDRELLAQAGGTSCFHSLSSAWDAPEQVGRHMAAAGKDIFATPSRRGRPPKRKAEDDPSTPPRKRGRPRKTPISAAAASPSPADGAGGSSAASLPTKQMQQGAGLVDSPMQAAQASPEAAQGAGTADYSSGSLAVPDSPADGAASRRRQRMMQTQSFHRPTSLLATAPVVASSGSEADQVHAGSPMPGTAETALPVTPKREAMQGGMQETPDNTVPAPSASDGNLGNLGNVADLLSAPAGLKTEADLNMAATPSAKRMAEAMATPASDRKKRTNLTQLRSSHALVQCIREAGGAMDALQIPELLSNFVERHGFASDAQLVNLRDKKVRDKALAAAVDNGLLRRTYVRVEHPSAAFPRRQIVHLPDLPLEQVHAYCDAVKKGTEGWFDTKNAKTALLVATDSVEVGEVDAKHVSKPWHHPEPMRLTELPTEPSQLALLRQPFRDVTSAYRQHLGYLGGEMLRLKAFHLACAHYVRLRQSNAEGDGAPTNDAALPLSFFWTEAPLDLYLALMFVLQMPEQVEQLALDPAVRQMPMHALPDELRHALGLSGGVPADVKVAFYSLATQLSDLGVFRIQSVSDGSGASDLVASTTTVEPRLRVPRYDWLAEEAEKPLVQVHDVGLDADKINLFWAMMQASCLKVRRGMQHAEGEGGDAVAAGASEAVAGHGLRVGDDIDPFKTLPEELGAVMQAHRAWRPFCQLRPSQVKFLHRVDVRDCASTSTDDVDRLAYVTLVPQSVVRAVLQHRWRSAQVSEEAEASLRQARPHFTWPLRLSVISLPTNVYSPIKVAVAAERKKRRRTAAEREKQGRMTTLAKARELRQRREAQFQTLLDQAFAEVPSAHTLREKIETALGVIRKKFVAGDVRFDAEAAEKAIARAVRSASGVRRMPTARTAPVARRRRAKPPAEQDAEPAQEAAAPAAGAEGGESGSKAKEAPKRDRRSRRNLDQANFWTAARKELLRDAAVILRVRDEVRGRSDWSALFQLFDDDERTKTKAVVMAQWRHQYQRMRTLYGEEAYLAALEARWIGVYLAARAEGSLEDAGFPSATGFDLAAQVELLREKIDKNEVQRSLVKPTARYALPVRLGEADFTSGWKEEFVEEPAERRFETYFSAEVGVTNKRFEKLLNTALGTEHEAGEAQVQVEERMAEVAVRIVVTTASNEGEANGAPGEDAVDEVVKAEFCASVGDARIEAAMTRMLELRLLRSVTSDPTLRRRPGTNFVLGDEMYKLLPDGGARAAMGAAELAATMANQAPALQELCAAEEGMLVQPVETDGEAAAMMLLMELGVAQGSVDTRPFEALRSTAAFNARVLNDDHLECLVRLTAEQGAMRSLDANVLELPSLPEDRVLAWLATSEPELEEAWRTQLESKDVEVRGLALKILQAGAAGLHVGADVKNDVVRDLLEGERPVAFWSPLGARPVLVASVYVRTYTLALPHAESLPHVWSTLHPPQHPVRVRRWRGLLDTALAIVRQRPGITLVALAALFHPKLRAAPAVSINDVAAAVQALEHVQAIYTQPCAHGLISLHIHPLRPLATFRP